MLQTWCRLLAALALCAGGVARGDGSMRCGGRLVSVGDARIDLLGRCGEPALRERRVEEGWSGAASGGVVQGGRTTTIIEEWTYDFGPQALVNVVTLVNGRITDIQTRSYGYTSSTPNPVRMPRARCGSGAVHEGDGKLDLLARCGEPAMIDAWDEVPAVVVLDPGSPFSAGSTVRVEIWTYDMGPNQFVRFVRLENGRVTSITTGTYGYAD